MSPVVMMSISFGNTLLNFSISSCLAGSSFLVFFAGSSFLLNLKLLFPELRPQPIPVYNLALDDLLQSHNL